MTILELNCGGCLRLTQHVPAPAEYYPPGTMTCCECGYTDLVATLVSAAAAATNSTQSATSPRPRPDVADTPAPAAEPLLLVDQTAEDFAAVDEEGARSLVGEEGQAVLPEGGAMMIYGDGGAGKTTLSVDLSCHLAAGDDWLGITIAEKACSLIIEDEGPRPFFRKKIKRKIDGWAGSPLEQRVRVIEKPWAKFTFAQETHRIALAAKVKEREIDVVFVGPVVVAGMEKAGTLQDVREFLELVDEVRERSGRRVTFVLVHHENKGGAVSGAWEGAGDTLIHLSAQGHGKTRLYIQKARWAHDYHLKTLQLAWADGEGFTVEEKEELDDDRVADLIVAAITSNPGTGWTKVEEATRGVRGDRRREVRDRLLRGGVIVNVGKDENGLEVALDHCPEKKKARLYPAGDPTIQHLRPGADADGTQTASAGGEDGQRHLRPASRPIGTQEAGTQFSPRLEASADEDELERLEGLFDEMHEGDS